MNPELRRFAQDLIQTSREIYRDIVRPGLVSLDNQSRRPAPRMSRRVFLAMMLAAAGSGYLARVRLSESPQSEQLTSSANKSSSQVSKPESQPTPPAILPSSKIDIPTTQSSAEVRLGKVVREITDVPANIRKAFIDGGTSAYSGVSTPDQLQRVRTLEFSDTTTKQIIDRARAGNMFMRTLHPAVIAEFEFLTQWAKQPKEKREQLLEMYAQGVVEGLTRLYDKNLTRAIALESGHMSLAPAEKINKIIADRTKRNVNTPLYPTQDTGASAQMVEDGQTKTVLEKNIAYQVSQLIAVKIMEQTRWIPVFNSRSQGFPVDRFIEKVNDNDTYYIHHRDSIVSMRYKWERLAGELEKVSIPMVRMAIHFNGSADQSAKGGYFIPQNAKFKEESTKIASILSSTIQEKVRAYSSDYKCGVNTSLNSNQFDPYWMLDDYDLDNPDNVSKGNIQNVRGATNRVLAQIRCESLGRRDCN